MECPGTIIDTREGHELALAKLVRGVPQEPAQPAEKPMNPRGSSIRECGSRRANQAGPAPRPVSVRGIAIAARELDVQLACFRIDGPVGSLLLFLGTPDEILGFRFHSDFYARQGLGCIDAATASPQATFTPASAAPSLHQARSKYRPARQPETRR
jgi:hypothetical protein